MSHNRSYAIVPIENINEVDFSEVLETSKETVVKSVDGTLFFVKWEGETPLSISTIANVVYKNYDEIISILGTPEWADPITAEIQNSIN